MEILQNVIEGFSTQDFANSSAKGIANQSNVRDSVGNATVTKAAGLAGAAIGGSIAASSVTILTSLIL